MKDCIFTLVMGLACVARVRMVEIRSFTSQKADQRQ